MVDAVVAEPTVEWRSHTQRPLQLLPKRAVGAAWAVGLGEVLGALLLQLFDLVEGNAATRPLPRAEKRRCNLAAERSPIPPHEVRRAAGGQGVRAVGRSHERILADDLVQTVLEGVAAGRVAYHYCLIDVEVQHQLDGGGGPCIAPGRRLGRHGARRHGGRLLRRWLHRVFGCADSADLGHVRGRKEHNEH